MTRQTNQLYLVVHYVESHVLAGQCRVKVALMLSTSIIAWSTGSRYLLCTVSDVPSHIGRRQGVPDEPDEIHEVDHVGHYGAVPLVSQCTVHNMAHPSMMTASVTL